MQTYKLFRFFVLDSTGPKKRTLRRGLTLREAQRHCQNPESSSLTCKLSRNVKRTKERGPWIDMFTKE